MNIVQAEFEPTIALVRELFEEYAASLPFDLSFQDFQQEVSSLPGQYGPPQGRLILAVSDAGSSAGCVGLRPFAAEIGEIKRLYVRPAFRGQGVGQMLVLAILDEARSIGYRRVRLDTVASMTDANRLYESLGFEDIAPYRDNPLPGARFLEKELYH
jgi:putative acetyltransferase